jgi:hypothetical protein
VGHFCQIDELLVELMMENRVLKKKVCSGMGVRYMGTRLQEKSRIIRLVEQSSLVTTAHPGPDQSQHPRE